MNGTKQLDEELRKHALEAQRHPPRSRHRQIALHKLMEGILRSGRIARPYRYQFPDFYEDIRTEAIQKTAFYLCNNIEKYNPEKGPVMRWFNYMLERRFFPEAIPEIVGTSNLFFKDPAAIDILASEEKISPLLSEQVREYLEEDPEDLLQNLTHQVYKKVNFWDLISRRMAGEKWKDIAAELGIPASTLSDFFQRNLKKAAPQIKRYLES